VTRKRSSATVVAVLVLGALGLATGMALRGRSAIADDVATFTVVKSRFTRRVHADGNLRAVKATELVAPVMPGTFGSMKIAWVAGDGTFVHQGDAVARFDPSEPAKQLKTGQADRDQAEAKLGEAQLKAQASESDRQSEVVQAAAELEVQHKFESKDQQIFSRNDIITSQIDEGLANATEQHAEQAKVIESKVSHSDVALIAVDRHKAELAISHAKAALASMELDAPHDGILVLHRNHKGELPKLGDSLWPGQRLGELPQLDAMEAEVFVLEVDGSGLAEKLPAELVIEAHPERKYMGKVRLVEKLAQTREEGSPVQYFAVVVALDKTDGDVMKPGQRVQATIVLDDEDALVVPREAVVEKDNKDVVYRKGEHGFVAVAVELGTATTGRVVIKSGLSAGDVIALRDPTLAPKSTGSASGNAAPEHK
jgi:HlyD family secretion protein